MKTLKKEIIIGVIVALALLAGGYLYLGGKEAGLGGSAIEQSLGCATATATSSPAFMTAGTATTTVTCPLGRQGVDKPETATLLLQVNASSTATTFEVYIEESIDNVDWYPLGENQHSSTTNQPFDFAARPFFSAVFASTSIGQDVTGASLNRLGTTGDDNRNHYEIEIPVRLNYVRAIGVLASSTVPDREEASDSGAMWMHIIPKTSI